MVAASVILLAFMHTGYRISKREAILLILVWLTYIATELLVNAYMI